MQLSEPAVSNVERGEVGDRGNDTLDYVLVTEDQRDTNLLELQQGDAVLPDRDTGAAPIEDLESERGTSDGRHSGLTQENLDLDTGEANDENKDRVLRRLERKLQIDMNGEPSLRQRLEEQLPPRRRVHSSEEPPSDESRDAEVSTDSTYGDEESDSPGNGLDQSGSSEAVDDDENWQDSGVHSDVEDPDVSEDEMEPLVIGKVQSEQAIPKSVFKVMSGDDAGWKAAVKTEQQNFRQQHALRYVEHRPKDYLSVPAFWLFTQKISEEGTLKKKARLVISGDKVNIPNQEVFAPTTSHLSLRLMLVHAATHGGHLASCDLSSAFLNADIPKDVKLSIPNSLFHGTKGMKGSYLLRRAVYGLRFSPRLFGDWLKQQLVRLGYRSSVMDPMMYVHPRHGTRLLVYADDILISSFSHKELKKAVNEVSMIARSTVRLYPKRYLGLDLHYGKGQITASLNTYLKKKVMTELNFSNGEIEGAQRPACDRKWLIEAQDDKNVISTDIYRKLVGILGYCATLLRWDLSFPTALLRRAATRPTATLLDYAFRLVRYLCKTRATVQVFRALKGKPDIDIYTDASHACWYTAKGQAGAVVCLEGNVVDFLSKGMELAVVSSSESEALGMFYATRNLPIYVHLVKFVFNKQPAVKVITDSQPLKKSLIKSLLTPRMKHLRVRLLSMLEYLEVPKNSGASAVDVDYQKGTELVADLLTKYYSLQRMAALMVRFGLNVK